MNLKKLFALNPDVPDEINRDQIKNSLGNRGVKEPNSTMIYFLNKHLNYCFDNPEIIKYKFATDKTIVYDTIDTVSTSSPDVSEMQQLYIGQAKYAKGGVTPVSLGHNELLFIGGDLTDGYTLRDANETIKQEAQKFANTRNVMRAF